MLGRGTEVPAMGENARIVFTTFESREQATEAISKLLDERLAACAQMLDIESMYLWQGERRTDKEVLVLLKTTESAYQALKEALCRNHPYEVPEIISVASDDVSAAYMQWMQEALR